MLDGFHILTLTHRDAPLGTIANAILPEKNAAGKLSELAAIFDWEELMYLATCNRVTYIFYSQHIENEDFALEFLKQARPDLSREDLLETAACARILNGAAAVTHILEVAASMDSLVVGEREILRQLRARGCDAQRGPRQPCEHVRSAATQRVPRLAGDVVDAFAVRHAQRGRGRAPRRQQPAREHRQRQRAQRQRPCELVQPGREFDGHHRIHSR